jgi:hypothetical protein
MLLFRKESTKNTGADRSFLVKTYIHREGAIINVQIAPSQSDTLRRAFLIGVVICVRKEGATGHDMGCSFLILDGELPPLPVIVCPAAVFNRRGWAAGSSFRPSVSASLPQQQQYSEP